MQTDIKTSLLIQSTLKGDQQAFGKLVKMHEAMLLAFARYRLPVAEEATEAVQDSFVRAYEQLADFRLDADFGTWLRSICRYMILSRAKSYSRRKVKHDDYVGQLKSLMVQQVSDQPDLAPEHDLLAYLSHCREELNGTNRDLLEDRYQKALSTQELSKKTGRTTTWVTSTLHRVRSALRTCIEKQMKEQSDEC